jgi:RNA polymerase sigma-70 factor (ECF subfamily)
VADDLLTRDAPLRAHLAAIAAGDQAALKSLYDETGAKLFGVVLRIVRNREAAEDVLQDVYLRIWQNAGAYVPTAGRPITWMCAIARNRAIDMVRARKETPLTDLVDGEDWMNQVPDPYDGESDILDRGALALCLGRFDDLHRQCLVMAYCEGFSREELAARFGRPVNTIKTWLHRGLASLRSCLEANA